jgi:molybdopterin synthase catalytic subunit
MPFRTSPDPLDPAALEAGIRDDRAGAYATFVGRVRDENEGRRVRTLEYEAHQALAESEGARILDEARDRFSILAARCVHRTGTLAIGDAAIWVGVAAAHRDAAFEACRYIVDETKARVPIWKKEHYSDGESAWLNSRGEER